MKKVISIKKGMSFNENSKVFLLINDKRILLNNYLTKNIEVEKNDIIQLNYWWVKSKTISFDFLEQDSLYEITQMINKKKGFIFFIIISFSIILFFITNSIWFSLPAFGVGIYIVLITTCFSDRYLKLKKVKNKFIG